MAVEHFKRTSMHLWQVGCTGNLMTEHVIPWNGGLVVLFSAAGLLPLLNLARQFASFKVHQLASLTSLFCLSLFWWSKLNTFFWLALLLGPAQT